MERILDTEGLLVHPQQEQLPVASGAPADHRRDQHAAGDRRGSKAPGDGRRGIAGRKPGVADQERGGEPTDDQDEQRLHLLYADEGVLLVELSEEEIVRSDL
jgi:hypothetical protein